MSHILQLTVKVDFHFLLATGTVKWSRLISLIILLSHRKVFLSVWSCEKVELSSTFSRQLNRKGNANQSNRVIFENTALLLFLSSQSNCSAIFVHVTVSQLKIKYLIFHFLFSCFCAHSHCQTDKWNSTFIRVQITKR